MNHSFSAAPAPRIRKIILATAAAIAGLAAQTAFAQQGGVQGLTYQTATDTVTLYGLIDVTMSNKNNANVNGDRLTDYQVSWFSGNRWGITGKHALGSGGLNAIFKLESEYVANTGEEDTPGVLFNRDAWLGFDSEDLGKLTFGRQNTLARDFSQNYGDAYGSANTTLDEGGWTNTNNFKQMIFYAASVTSTRYDNGMVWKKKFGDAVVVGLGHQFGSPGVPGAMSKNTTSAAGLAYNAGIFNVSGFYNTANVNGLTHKSYSVGGNAQFDIVRVNAGYFHYTADQGLVGQRKDNAYTVSTKIAPAGSFDYELGYQIMKEDNGGYNGSGNFFNAYANASAAKTSGSGQKKTLYASAFYHFDKRTELYLAADRMNLTEGYHLAVTNGHNSQTEVGIGMRFKF